MSTSEQRRQWAEHIADERQALQLQQQAAGPTHSPKEGPLPYTEDQMHAAIAAAVAAERHRCAELADAWSTESKLLEAFTGLTEGELRVAAAIASAVAGEIRGSAAKRQSP